MPEASARLQASSNVYTRNLIWPSGSLLRSFLGRMMTSVRPCLSVHGITNCFPVASFSMSCHLISWGLYVRRLHMRTLM